MSEGEVKNKRLDLLSDFIRKIVNMSPLETEESATKKTKRIRIKNINAKINDYKIAYFINSIKSRKQFTKTEK